MDAAFFTAANIGLVAAGAVLFLGAAATLVLMVGDHLRNRERPYAIALEGYPQRV